MAKENRLFIGNAGTGKSTLINCLVGTFVFQSGEHRDGSLTQYFQRFEANGVTYMDTPGLSSNKTFIEPAAQEITTALKQSGFFKLFFMVRFEDGSVNSEDLSTMESVLDSIEIQDVVYSVIVNNIDKKLYNTFSSGGAEFDAIVALINSGRYSTTSICFIPTIDQLIGESNKVVELPPRVVNFIEMKAPVNCNFQSEAKDIEGKDFQHRTDKIQEKLEEIQRGKSQEPEKNVKHEASAPSELPEPEAHVAIDVDNIPAYPTAIVVEPIEPTHSLHTVGSSAARQSRPQHSVHRSMGNAPQAPRAPYAAHPSTPHANNDNLTSDEMLMICFCCLCCGPIGVCCYLLCCRDEKK
ncbi:hypothetical protein PHYBOEH_009263 [Phytophthora boehmeriae]|uniref:AIG1-type G domain-containing protein n=1 Tax=Phytophthora boehmeriae TaxID=109152 RepID=A0A8T1VY10_9STRA|nr:hypothetical protein PHYBOEH_009263 [Phytophthora boehmeriae]